MATHTSNSSVMTQQKTAALFLTLAKNYYLPLMEQVHAEAITHDQAATTSPVLITKSANYKHTERNNNDRRTHVNQIVTNTPLLLPPIAASPPTYPLLHLLDKHPDNLFDENTAEDSLDSDKAQYTANNFPPPHATIIEPSSSLQLLQHDHGNNHGSNASATTSSTKSTIPCSNTSSTPHDPPHAQFPPTTTFTDGPCKTPHYRRCLLKKERTTNPLKTTQLKETQVITILTNRRVTKPTMTAVPLNTREEKSNHKTSSNVKTLPSRFPKTQLGTTTYLI